MLLRRQLLQRDRRLGRRVERDRAPLQEVARVHHPQRVELPGVRGNPTIVEQGVGADRPARPEESEDSFEDGAALHQRDLVQDVAQDGGVDGRDELGDFLSPALNERDPIVYDPGLHDLELELGGIDGEDV